MSSITELRDHLFATLKDLRSPDKPLDIERAKAIAEVAQVVINSAKVEVDHMKLTGGKGSGFITEKLPSPGQPRLVKGRDMVG